MYTAMRMLALAEDLTDQEETKQGFRKIVWDMEAANESDRAITLALISAALDGMRWGNWPTPEGKTKAALAVDLHPHNMVHAIKYLRTISGIGLKEAKDQVETEMARRKDA